MSNLLYTSFTRRVFLLLLPVMLSLHADLLYAKGDFLAGDLNTKDVRVSGNVKDESGNNLAGVSVVYKNSAIGTYTDQNGNFTITIPRGTGVFVFSYVGMRTKEVNINNRTIVNVVLESVGIDMEEAVAIGYGTVRRKDLTGSVASIKGEDLLSGATQSLDAALAGKISGVQVTQISGVPGSGTNIRIRGANSIMADNEPLYVIDGIPMNGGDGAAGLDVGEGANISPISQINPSDIESIDILKDASATAIYGSRGANGVILITTKRGSKGGQTNINFSSYVGMSELDKKIPVTNATEYTIMLNELFTYNNQALQNTRIDTLGVGTDWQDAISRKGVVQNYTLSVSGGTQQNKYLVSLNYMNQDGIVINSNFKRLSLRANFDTDLKKWLKFGNSISLVRTTGNLISSGNPNNNDIIGNVLTSRPTVPVKQNGEYTPYIDEEGNSLGNPVARALYLQNFDARNRIFGNFYGEATLVKNLKFKSTFGYDLTASKTHYYAPSTIAVGAVYKGYARIGTMQGIYWNSTNTLTYDLNINANNRLNVMGGVTWEKSYNETTRSDGTGFVTDALKDNDLSSAEKQYTFSNATSSALHSYIGRLNYSFMDKYLFTLTGRADGSSRFGENNKYAFFPSAAFAWRASDEAFLKDVKWLSNLKLRLSAGSTGEQAIPPYQSLALYQSAPLSLGTGIVGIGYYPSQMANQNLQWERSNQADVGLDIGILNNKVTFTIDGYYKVTNALLFNIEIPKTYGYYTALKNIGKIENKGIEFMANVVAIDKKFKWDFSLNLSANRNRVLSLAEGVNEIIAPTGGAGSADLKSNPSIIKVGYPLGTLYGYVFDGIFQNQEEVDAINQTGASVGDMRIKDLDANGIITPADKTVIGDANPDYIGGFINNFSYKRFSLKSNFQWSVGNDMYSLQQLYLMNVQSRRNLLKSFYNNRWTPDNPTNTTPRSGYNPLTFPDNSYYLHDASYFRCKNITLSYNFNTGKVKAIKNARIYASADNLFTITDYMGYNPDASAFGNRNLAPGIDVGVYPLAKTYIIGLNLTF